jgi:hypothetical protein
METEQEEEGRKKVLNLPFSCHSSDEISSRIA